MAANNYNSTMDEIQRLRNIVFNLQTRLEILEKAQIGKNEVKKLIAAQVGIDRRPKVFFKTGGSQGDGQNK